MPLTTLPQPAALVIPSPAQDFRVAGQRRAPILDDSSRYRSSNSTPTRSDEIVSLEKAPTSGRDTNTFDDVVALVPAPSESVEVLPIPEEVLDAKIAGDVTIADAISDLRGYPTVQRAVIDLLSGKTPDGVGSKWTDLASQRPSELVEFVRTRLGEAAAVDAARIQNFSEGFDPDSDSELVKLRHSTAHSETRSDNWLTARKLLGDDMTDLVPLTREVSVPQLFDTTALQRLEQGRLADAFVELTVAPPSWSDLSFEQRCVAFGRAMDSRILPRVPGEQEAREILISLRTSATQLPLADAVALFAADATTSETGRRSWLFGRDAAESFRRDFIRYASIQSSPPHNAHAFFDSLVRTLDYTALARAIQMYAVPNEDLMSGNLTKSQSLAFGVSLVAAGERVYPGRMFYYPHGSGLIRSRVLGTAVLDEINRAVTDDPEHLENARSIVKSAIAAAPSVESFHSENRDQILTMIRHPLPSVRALGFEVLASSPAGKMLADRFGERSSETRPAPMPTDPQFKEISDTLPRGPSLWTRFLRAIW